MSKPGEFGKPWEVRLHPWGGEWWVVTAGWKPGGVSAGEKVCSTSDLTAAVKIARNHNASLKREVKGGPPRLPLTADLIAGAMGLAKGRIGKAAEMLGVHRHTLREHLKEHFGQ